MVARKKPKKAPTGDTIRERPESVRAKKLPNIYLRDKLYIPTRFVDEDVVIRQYTHCEFDDNVCRTCDLRSARPCNDCYECQWGGLKGTFLMAGHKVVSGRPYYTVPLGDIDNVEYKLGIDFDDFNLVDKTTRKKFAYPIKYTGQLYDYQEAPVRNILKYKMGILKSKPRTGKTVMATAAICKYGQRAIIMADQKDFLDGFLETFHAVTNVLQLEEECGHKLVGFPKTLKDFDTLQVILITYQQLIKNTKAAKDKLRKLRTLYGVLCVDEVHRTCAPQFSRILGLMTTRMRFGLSATPHRKDCVVGGSLVVMADGSHKAIEDIVAGDMVTSYDVVAGRFEPKPVVLTHAVRTTKRRVRVHHAHGTLECTEDHEVWTVNRGYVKAIDLTPTDVLQLGDD